MRSLDPYVAFALLDDAHNIQCEKGAYNSMLKRLNHIAIAVPNAEKAAEVYRLNFACEPSSPEDLPDHGVRVVFVDVGNTKLEFISPIGENSPISKFLTKNPKGGVHHLCFEVENVTEALDKLKQNSIEPVGFPEPKTGAHGHPVIFLPPGEFAGTLIELEEVEV